MHGLTFYGIRMHISRFVMGTTSLFVGSMAFFVGHLLDHRMTFGFSHSFTNFIVFCSIGYLDFRATFLSGSPMIQDNLSKNYKRWTSTILVHCSTHCTGERELWRRCSKVLLNEIRRVEYLFVILAKIMSFSQLPADLPLGVPDYHGTPGTPSSDILGTSSNQ